MTDSIFPAAAPWAVQTATLTATGQSATFTNVDQAETLQVTAKGTYGFTTTPPTYVFEGSDDAGTTWYPISVVREDLAFKEQGGTLSANLARSWSVPVAGFAQVRMRLTAWGTPSGTGIVVRCTPNSVANEPVAGPVANGARQNLVLFAAGVAGVVAETLVSLTPSVDFVNGTAATTQSPPAGKKWRITNAQLVWRNNTAVVGGVTCRIRVNPTGAVAVASPMVGAVNANSGANAAIGGGGSDNVIFGEGGLQLDSGQNIGITQQAIGAVVGFDVLLIGFQY